MTERSLLRLPQAKAALRQLNKWFFDNIQVSEAWVNQVRELSQQGQVVYVLRNLNVMDYLALSHLIRRYDLPKIAFVNDFQLPPLNGKLTSWLTQLGIRPPQAVALQDALTSGRSAALFLKRPPGMFDVAAGASGGRGLIEGDSVLQTLINLQRHSERQIILLPQVILWTSRPNTQGTHLIDYVLGPREWPSSVRTMGQLLANYGRVELRSCDPLSLQHFLKNEPQSSDEVLVRKIVYAMLRRLERERRSATGPAQKPPDRQRLQVLRSPKLQQVINSMAGERKADRLALTRRAQKTLNELQATPNSAAVKALEVLLDRIFNRIYAGIDVDLEGIERLRELAKEGTLILLPSHKSHVDYLVISYLCNEHNIQLPMIAAGDNLSFFPLGPLFRRAGAFFIRRSFRGDRLYAATLEAYVRRLLRDGHTIEVFIEGGRSRTGKLLKPQLGLLSMLVDGATSLPYRTVHFVPASIGYERIIEASAYEHEVGGGEKHKEDAAALLKSTEVLRHRYGRINLQIGQPLTLAQMRTELGLPDTGPISPAQRRAVVVRLGNRTMDEINRVTAVTPGALTATALLSEQRRSIADEDLLDRCQHLVSMLYANGARVTPSTATDGKLREESIHEAIQMFVDAGLLEAHEPGNTSKSKKRNVTGRGILYRIPEDKRLELDTSKNHIVQFFVERSLVAMAFLMHKSDTAQLELVRDRVHQLSRLFKHEFRFRADASFEEIFFDTLSAMERDKELVRDNSELALGEGRDGWSARIWLETYASILTNFVESYRIAARGLRLLTRGPLPDKELVKKTLTTGRRMFLSGEVERPEAISKPLFENAFQCFVNEGYLRLSSQRYALTDSFMSEEAVGAIEGRLAGYLDLKSE